MTKDELKSNALESMSKAGSLIQEGNFQQAKDLAEKAWNYYYELQKHRGDDEDYSDLIYYARDMYNQAKEELERQVKEQKRESEEPMDYIHYEFTIEDLEEDLANEISKLKETIDNNAPDSYPVFQTTYNLLIDYVLLAEKRIKDKRDCWKNIQLVKDLVPRVREMLKSQYLDKQGKENMLDLSLRAFDCIDNTLCTTSPLSCVRLKRERESLIIEIAQVLPEEEQNLKQYLDILNILEYYISKADNDQLDAVVVDNEEMVFDPIELTVEYEKLLPEADQRGETAYRMKGDTATIQDFYNAKRLFLAGMGLNWTPPREANSTKDRK